MKYLILFIAIITCTAARVFAQCDTLAYEIPNNGLDEDCDGNDELYLHLPPAIYCLEGQDFELYFRNIFLSKHPETYLFEVTCTLGGVFSPQKWSFTPTANDIGNHPITVSIKDDLGQVLDSKSTIIRVASAAMPTDSSQKRLILMGHSFFDQGYLPKHVYDRTHQANNPPISFHGKRVSWANNQARHEGYGGRNWQYFATNSQSPILYNGNIDFRQYFDEVIGEDLNPDWMIFHLDINDFCGYSPILATDNNQTFDDSITSAWNRFARPILDSLQAVSPNTKIAICYSPFPNGVDTTFNAFNSINPMLNNPWRWRRIISRLLFKNTERYGNRENQQIWLLPIHLDIDVINEYPLDDPIHPDYSTGGWSVPHGYTEIAKTMYAWIKQVQHIPTFTFYRDADNDGYGSTNDSITAYYLPTGFVLTATDCNDNAPNIHPGATEVCNNGEDDNCDGSTDEDFIPPNITCQDITLALNANSAATFTELDMQVEASDNCSNIIFTPFVLNFNCFSVGDSFPQAYSITDAAGNTASCNYTIHVIDTTDTDGDNITDCFDLCPNNGELTTPFPFYIDQDMDGYGSFETFYSCFLEQGLSNTAGDCDDDDNQVYPGQLEIAENGIDDNCNDTIDEIILTTFDPFALINMAISPNPTSGNSQLTWTNGHPIAINIYHATGQKLSSFPVAQGTTTVGLPTQALPIGLYRIEVIFADGSRVGRAFLKQ